MSVCLTLRVVMSCNVCLPDIAIAHAVRIKQRCKELIYLHDEMVIFCNWRNVQISVSRNVLRGVQNITVAAVSFGNETNEN